MINLSSFVENRQQDDETKKRRQVVGDLHRVPVPPTRFNRAVSMPMDQVLGAVSLKSSDPRLEPVSYGRRESHVFDTDAESIGESTTMSILPKEERLSYATKAQLTDENLAPGMTAGPQNRRHLSRGQHEEPGLPDHEAIVPGLDDGAASESDSGKDSRGPTVLSRISTDIQSEEFIGFKKRNILNTSLFQTSHTSRKNTPDARLIASLYAPVDAIENTIPSSSQSPPSSHKYAKSTLTPKDRYPGHDRSKPADFPVSHIKCNLRDASPSFAVQERLTNVKTHQHRDHTSRTLPQDRQFDLEHVRDTVKPAFNSELLYTDFPFVHQSGQEFADRGILGSQSSDGDAPKAGNGRGSTQGVLKRKLSLDRSSDQLHNMKFQDLLEDQFDGISTPIASLPSSEVALPSLRAILEQFSSQVNLQDSYAQHEPFFKRISLGQYIECGNIIAELLNEKISNLSRIRQQKREVISNFEVEITQREAALRMRVAALKRMKGVMTRQTEELTTQRIAQRDLGNR